MSKATLIGITKPTIEGINTAEELIAYAARVSNPSNQMNAETAPKLLKYLMNNQHWSPLEMVHVLIEIETTRDIARQILRHRSFAFQEFSQRYANASNLGFELRETRLQDKKNRQNSIDLDLSDEMNQKLAIDWHKKQNEILEKTKEIYSWAINNGISKEQARAVLPEGITHSRLYMSGTFRSWYHYVQLRCGNGTQKEHRIVAEQCKEILKKEFPNSFEE